MKNKRNYKHGHYLSPTHRSWGSMHRRVRQPSHEAFAKYCALGICADWYHFENFFRDMGQRPAGCSLDRIDNLRGYSKSNCRWATNSQQMSNTSKNVFITHNNETLTIPQWASQLRISKHTIWHRLNKLGWPIEKALTPRLYSKHGVRADLNEA